MESSDGLSLVSMFSTFAEMWSEMVVVRQQRSQGNDIQVYKEISAFGMLTNTVTMKKILLQFWHPFMQWFYVGKRPEVNLWQ